jgi:asparagine synthase (glutamine-hydrolysing)
VEAPTEVELLRRLEAAERQVARLQAQAERRRSALDAARQRLRRRGAQLDRMKAALARARETIDEIGGFSLDVFPDLAMPEDLRQAVGAVRAERLSYLTEPQLESLAKCVLETEVSGRQGLIVEAGTALGGSAIAMAAAKSPGRPMRVYDVFGMIPPPGELDADDSHSRYDDIVGGRSTGLGDDVYYGYHQDLLSEVTASFARHGLPIEENNVSLVAGLFEDVLDIDGPVAFAHIDADWYSSTMTCLDRIAPHLTPGGRIVVDDYRHWKGCRRAVDEYFADRPEYRVEQREKVHIVRK